MRRTIIFASLPSHYHSLSALTPATMEEDGKERVEGKSNNRDGNLRKEDKKREKS